MKSSSSDMVAPLLVRDQAEVEMDCGRSSALFDEGGLVYVVCVASENEE